MRKATRTLCQCCSRSWWLIMPDNGWAFKPPTRCAIPRFWRRNITRVKETPRTTRHSHRVLFFFVWNIWSTVVEHLLAMLNAWVQFPLEPKIFINYLLASISNFCSRTMPIFRSQPMTLPLRPTAKCLRSELFNVVVLTIDERNTWQRLLGDKCRVSH